MREGALVPDAMKPFGTLGPFDCQCRVPLIISRVNCAEHIVSVKPVTGETFLHDRELGVTVALNPTGSPTLKDMPGAVVTMPLAQYCCAKVQVRSSQSQ